MSLRLNLDCGENVRNDCVNVISSPISFKNTNETSKVVISDPKDLNALAEDSTIDEIIYYPPLNKLRPNDIVKTLHHWWKKLKPNGELKLMFIDIRKLSRIVHMGNIPLQDIHNAIYGENGELNSIIDSSVTEVAAKEIGFTIKTIVPQDIVITMELIKNANH